MPTNIQMIQPQRADFRTQSNGDWTDGVIVCRSGAGGVVAGSANAGNGTLLIDDVAPFTARGAHVVEVTSIDGLPRITVTDPTGAVTARGVAGLALYANGLLLRLMPGSVAFAVGDTFAVGVLPVPIDITGIAFSLQARATARSASIALSATSAPPAGTVPTIAVGTVGGQVSMRKLQPSMDLSVFAEGTYVHDILAIADGLRVPAFYGTIEHVAGVTYLP